MCVWGLFFPVVSDTVADLILDLLFWTFLLSVNFLSSSLRLKFYDKSLCCRSFYYLFIFVFYYLFLYFVFVLG